MLSFPLSVHTGFGQALTRSPHLKFSNTLAKPPQAEQSSEPFKLFKAALPNTRDTRPKHPSVNTTLSLNEGMAGSKRLPITLDSLRELAQLPSKQIEFKLPSGHSLTHKDRQDVLQKLIEANLLALGHQGAHPLRSGTHSANIVEMDNGVTGKGVNTEGHVELSVCAERAAIVNAVLSSSERYIHDTLTQLIPPLKPDSVPKVKRTYQAGDRLQPCSECLPWMQAQIFYTPDTESYLLKQYMDDEDPQKSKWVVECRRVKDILPLHQTMSAPYTHKSLSRSRFLISEAAQKQIKKAKVAETDLIKLIAQAKETFLAIGSNPLLTPRTYRNMVAGVLLSDGTLASAPYVEIRRYSHSLADFAAFNMALQQSPYFQKYVTGQSAEPPKIRAIAYYGTNADFPTASQLNTFSHRNWGGPETLILTPSDRGVHIRTIADYLPYNFNEDKMKPSTNGKLNAYG